MGNVERCDKTLPLNEIAFTLGPAEVLAYMPAIEWRSGTGMVTWPVSDAG